MTMTLRHAFNAGAALKCGRSRERLPSRAAIDPSRQGGFSLIELMIALVLAGILLFGLAVFFVSSSRSYGEAERVSRQIENGRYAMALMARRSAMPASMVRSAT